MAEFSSQPLGRGHRVWGRGHRVWGAGTQSLGARTQSLLPTPGAWRASLLLGGGGVAEYSAEVGGGHTEYPVGWGRHGRVWFVGRV